MDAARARLSVFATRLWIELDTGETGYVKLLKEMPDSLEEFSLPNMPDDESIIAASGDIIWKNKFWVEAEDVRELLANRRNGSLVQRKRK